MATSVVAQLACAAPSQSHSLDTASLAEHKRDLEELGKEGETTGTNL